MTKLSKLAYPLLDNHVNDFDDIINLLVKLDKANYNFTNSKTLLQKYASNKASNAIPKNTYALILSTLFRDFYYNNQIDNKETKSEKIDAGIKFKTWNSSLKDYNSAIKKLRIKLKKMQSLISNFYIFGSLATLDYVKDWSDLDAMILVRKEVFISPKKLVEFRKLALSLRSVLYEVDLLQHHGFAIITEEETSLYNPIWFPPMLFDYSVSMYPSKKVSFDIREYDSDKKTYFLNYVDTIKHFCSKRPSDLFDLKFFYHTMLLVPTLYLQAKGKHVSKKVSFDIAKKDFDKDEWSVIESISKIRSNWKNPLRFNSKFISGLKNPFITVLFHRIFNRHYDKSFLDNNMISRSLRLLKLMEKKYVK